MRTTWVVACALVAGACLPEFPPLECVANSECLGGQCVDNLCVLGGAGVSDLGPSDLSPPDLGPGGPDMSDAGPEDHGPLDLGPGDLGPADLGPDAGFVAQLAPTELAFGPQPLGCAGPTRTAVVQNLGVTTVEVSQIRLVVGTSFTVAAPALPQRLGPAGSLAVPIRFSPGAVGPAQDELEVTYQAQTPLSARITGEGARQPLVTDRFEVRGGALSVLLVVDNGPGATALQAALGNLAATLVGALSGFDGRLGVTTTDVSNNGAAGSLLGSPRVIDVRGANPTLVLSQRLQVGQSGLQDAQGLEAATRALTAPLIGADNLGFLVPASAVLVIIASERADRSVDTPNQYAQRLAAVSAGPVVVNAIVPGRANCPLPSGGVSAAADSATTTVVATTGGTRADVCAAPSTWAPALTRLPPVPPARRFVLRQRAVAGTLEVRINGVRQPEGQAWSFDAAAGAVRFEDAAIPAFGSTVEVRYQARC